MYSQNVRLLAWLLQKSVKRSGRLGWVISELIRDPVAPRRWTFTLPATTSSSTNLLTISENSNLLVPMLIKKTLKTHLKLAIAIWTYQEKTFARLRCYRGRIGCQMITMRRVCVGVTRILSYQVTDPRKWKGFPVWNGDSLVTKNEMKSIER